MGAEHTALDACVNLDGRSVVDFVAKSANEIEFSALIKDITHLPGGVYMVAAAFRDIGHQVRLLLRRPIIQNDAGKGRFIFMSRASRFLRMRHHHKFKSQRRAEN